VLVIAQDLIVASRIENSTRGASFRNLGQLLVQKRVRTPAFLVGQSISKGIPYHLSHRLTSLTGQSPCQGVNLWILDI